MNYKDRFQKASKGLKKSIVSLLGDVRTKSGALRASINELGKALSRLQALAKKHHQSFASVVEDAPISIPRRTAYRYVELYNAAATSGVAALVEQAGFDPAQKRIVKKISKLGIKRVRRMSPVQLAEKLEKGAKTRTLLQKLYDAVRQAGRAYIKYAESKGTKLSLSEANSEMLELIHPMLRRIHKLQVVAKKAA
jgi:hypothetical protein